LYAPHMNYQKIYWKRFVVQAMGHLCFLALIVMSIAQVASATPATFVDQMENAQLESLAKVHEPSNKLFMGYGYTLRVQCDLDTKAIPCIREVYGSLIDIWSQPESLEILPASIYTNPNQLIQAQVKESASQMNEQETAYLTLASDALRLVKKAVKVKKLNLVMFSGTESNSFGYANFLALFDRSRNELLIIGNGYAE
jgi:hypothetical protein